MDKFISETIDKELSSDLDDDKQKTSKVKGIKAIEGLLSIEKFTTLGHTLRAISDCIKHLLDEKGFSCLLPRTNLQ